MWINHVQIETRGEHVCGNMQNKRTLPSIGGVLGVTCVTCVTWRRRSSC
jgi:hypothetical protein